MPRFTPPDWEEEEPPKWPPEWPLPPDWREDRLWLVAAAAIAIWAGVVVIIMIVGYLR